MATPISTRVDPIWPSLFIYVKDTRVSVSGHFGLAPFGSFSHSEGMFCDNRRRTATVSVNIFKSFGEEDPRIRSDL